jgi:hypothetical protein
MTTIEVGRYSVEFGLVLVEENPSLTFLLFIAFVLISVLGFRFAYYAWRNRRQSDVPVQREIWRYLQHIGTVALLYGAVSVLEIVSSISVPASDALLLTGTLLLAFALRQVYLAANTRDQSESLYAYERPTRAVFILAVVVYALAVTVFGQTDLTAALLGGSALAYVGYGMAYFYDQTSRARLQGTMLDSLLRHLLPILTFASLVSIVTIAVPFGLERVVVMHVQLVFIIMTATGFMTATVKLRQNLAGL